MKVDWNLPVKCVDECVVCDCCDEPWCPECDEHYTDCAHPGPTSEPDESCLPDDLENNQHFVEWFNSRPENIQIMILQKPPNRLYQCDATGNGVIIKAYHEDGTVTVTVDKAPLLLEYDVDVDPATLTPM